MNALMTANEAKNISTNIELINAREQWKMIEELMETVINRGNSNFSIKGNLEKPNQKKLEDLGYDVSQLYFTMTLSIGQNTLLKFLA